MHSLATYAIQHMKKKANVSINDTDERLEETYIKIRNTTKHIKYFNDNNNYNNIIKYSNKSTIPKQASSFTSPSRSTTSSSQIQLISTSSLDSIPSPSYSINNTQSPSSSKSNSESPHYKLTTMECIRSHTTTSSCTNRATALQNTRNNSKLSEKQISFSEQYIHMNTLGNRTSSCSDDSYCIDTPELIDNENDNGSFTQTYEYFNPLEVDIERDYGNDSLDSIINLFSEITLLGDDNKIDIDSLITFDPNDLRIELVNYENDHDYYNHKYLSISNDITIDFYPKSNRYCDSIKNGIDNDTTIELIFSGSEANDDFEDKPFGYDARINEQMGSGSSNNNQHNVINVSLTAELLAQHNKSYEHVPVYCASISSSDDDDILRNAGKELLLMEFENNNIDIADRFSRIGSVLLNNKIFEYDEEEEKIYENNNNNMKKNGIDIDHAYQLIQFINNNNSHNIFGFTNERTNKKELIGLIIDNTDADAYQLFLLINKTHNNHNNNNNEMNNVYGFDMNFIWTLSTDKEMINEKGFALVEDKIYDDDDDVRRHNSISIDMDDIWVLSDQPIVNENEEIVIQNAEIIEENETNNILSLGDLYNNYFTKFHYQPKTLQKFVNYVQSYENNSYRYVDIKIWWYKK